MARRGAVHSPLLGVGWLLLSVSCSPTEARRDAIDHPGRLPTGIPSLAIPIGGGCRIDFIAPEDGIVYLHDTRFDTLLLTKSLRRGDELRIENLKFSIRPAADAAEGSGSTEVREDIDLATVGSYSVVERVLYYLPNSLWVEKPSEGR